MNRKDRRAAGERSTHHRAVLDAVRAQAEAGACGDCDADYVLRDEGGVIHLSVMHDDTCPIFRAMRRPS